MTEGVKSASTGCGTDIIITLVMTVMVIFWCKQMVNMVIF